MQVGFVIPVETHGRELLKASWQARKFPSSFIFHYVRMSQDFTI